MDLRLTAMIATAHVQLRQTVLELYPHLVDEQLDHLKRHPKMLEDDIMTPNVKGLGSALAKLKHDLDVQATSALAEMSDLGQRATAAMGKAKQAIADTKASVEEIEAFVSEEGSNGGPPLSGSSTSSAAPAQPAPEAATATASPAAGTAEHLTVNGVSQA